MELLPYVIIWNLNETKYITEKLQLKKSIVFLYILKFLLKFVLVELKDDSHLLKK